MGNPHSPPNSNHFTKLPLDPIDSLVVLGKLLNEYGLAHEVVLIGGQALYLWSLRYPAYLPLPENAFLTSKDLDYVRRVGTSIELLVDTWKPKKLKMADISDPQTPHEALVYFVDVDAYSGPS